MSQAKVLVSSFARFVQGDIKGGEFAHAYRKEIIATAIEQAYKGNYSPITEAQTLTEGKAKKARAYAAGFAALGVIGDESGLIKVAYKGSLNANENKPAREAIAAKTAASVGAFFTAFDTVIAEKAAPKAKKADAAPVATPAGDETTANAPTVDAPNAARQLDDSVTSMENMLRTGILTGEQTDRIADALFSNLTQEQALELSRAMLARFGLEVGEPITA